MRIKRILIHVLLALGLINSGADNLAAAGELEEQAKMTDQQLEGTIQAPDFPLGLQWLNTDTPFSISDFRGKIVLLDFWTFCCINCMHVIPDLEKLEAKYPQELVVIGIHSAKFTNEKDSEAIRQAILRYEIHHPVVNDNGFQLWNEYGTRAWPTLVLINPKGKIIGTHSGEGIFDLFDAVIGQAISHFDAKGELKRSPLNLTPEMAKKERTVLSFPGKIAADPTGNRLLISDSNHNRVIITDPQGTIETIIGSGKLGNKDGPFAEAEFNHPQGLYLDGDVLYIADTENHLIRTANLATREVKTILGTGEQAHGYNVEGTGTAVALNSPWDLLVHDGKLYIAMAGPHQLWEADLKTLYARPYAGSGQEARIDGSLTGAALAQPSGITTDDKKLYFADSETSSIRSADLDPNGKVETIVGEDLFEYGDVDGGKSVARLQHPLGITFKDGLLYVADTYNSKIKIVDPVKKTSTALAGTGTRGLTGGALLQARFNEPAGLAFLGDSLYVADANNHQIRIVDLKNKTVSTLQFKNMKMLAQHTMNNFSGRIVNFPKQHLGAGKSKIGLSIQLPSGYHLNKEAPFYFDWKSGNDKVVKFTSRPEQLKITSAESFEIPVDAVKGLIEVTFETVVYFCKEGYTVCLFDNVRFKVPIQVDETGPSMFGLTINAKAVPQM